MVVTCPTATEAALAPTCPGTLRLLVLEGDPALREATVEALSRHGFSVAGGDSAEALYELPAGTHFDIALLDHHLPGEDAIELCARLRETQPDIGIVMLSASDSLDDRVAGYRHGADLCLGKPTPAIELCAALDALARRLTASSPVAGDGLVLELANGVLRSPNGQLSLRRQEVEALYGMALAPGNFLESWQLLERLGKPLDCYGKAQLEVMISRLRSRLKGLQPGGNPIRAERGRGYRLALPIQVHR